MLKEGRDEGGMETLVMWTAMRDGECRENRNLENGLGRMRPKHWEEDAFRNQRRQKERWIYTQAGLGMTLARHSTMGQGSRRENENITWYQAQNENKHSEATEAW